MSKLIKVSEEVYQHLLLLQRPRETFSEVVERLIKIYGGLSGLTSIIGGVKAFGEWKDDQLKKQDVAH